MTLHVALTHRTEYRYDRAVWRSPSAAMDTTRGANRRQPQKQWY
jgi:hypothetical protein